jgi:hypothetical protein
MWSETNVPVWLALIGLATVILTGTVSPILVGWFAARRDRRNKKEDYARQDAVANQAAEAARLLADRQDAAAQKAAEAARLLLAANERVAKTASVTNETLDRVEELSVKTHGLVNSEKTRGLETQEALLLEVIELKKVNGQKPLDSTVAHLKAVQLELEQRREYEETAKS